MNEIELKLRGLLEKNGFDVAKIDSSQGFSINIDGLKDSSEKMEVYNFLDELARFLGCKGFPDMFVWEDFNENKGIFIEIKSAKYKLSDKQKQKLIRINEVLKYDCFIARYKNDKDNSRK